MVLINIINSNKLRGGYYTPELLANFIVSKTVHSKKIRILEPSCGDGKIVISLAKRLHTLGISKNQIHKHLLGIEIDTAEAAMARTNLGEFGVDDPKKIIKTSEFFSYCEKNLINKVSFGAVVGNPPFLRYQDFPDRIKKLAFKLMSDKGLKPIGHTNSWVPFLVISSLLLNENGLLAMIVPAQLFQVSYAAETRKFLSNYYQKLTILTFEKLVFDDILQDIVVLLGERNNSKNKGIRVVEYRDINELKLNGNKTLEIWNDRNNLKPLDHTKDKWTQYFLNTDEILLIRRLREKFQDKICNEIMNVDIGVVTGRNKYFVLSKEEIEDRGLMETSKRIVRSTSQLKGVRFSTIDLKKIKSDSPSWLFKPSNSPFLEYPQEIQKYIKEGEKNGISQGYKCRIRKKWYIIPSTWVPDAFLLRQVYEYPKIIVNETDATCTDTIHRIKFNCKGKGEKIASAFLNSMTLSFSEILGRSYGGGVLTLEPSEAEQLPIPLVNVEKLDIKRIDRLERKHKINDILDMTDSIILKRGLGLEDWEISSLRNIWKKLRNRRLNKNTK